MLNNLTIKKRLLFLSTLIFITLVTMILVLFNTVNDTQNYGMIKQEIERMKSDMLTLRKNEKDFIQRKDMKYVEEFDKNILVLTKNTNELNTLLKKYSIDNTQVNEYLKIINLYKSSFMSYKSAQEKIGLNEKLGLYGSLRDSVHKVQEIAKNSKNYELLATVYDLRKQEKDFMLRRDTKYVDDFKSKVEALQKNDNIVNSEINNLLSNYKKDFLSLVEAEIIIGLTSKDGLQGELRDTVHKTEGLLNKLSTDIEIIVNDKISFITKFSAIFGIVLLIAIISLVVSISNNLSNSISNFQMGLLDFFRYINKEIQDISHLQVSGNDEISHMTQVVNQNISKSKQMIEDDKNLINEAKNVIGMVKVGLYNNKIKATTSNQALNEFKNNVNDMIQITNEHFANINKILEEYVAYDYTKELALNNIDQNGVFAILLKDISSLRNSITQMLVDSRTNGLHLQQSANILMTNVNTLSSSTTQAASSLEETAVAIEEITSNIQHNTQNISQMAQNAKDVITSAKDGEQLANKTKLSMDEINERIISMNNSITVIDQIAFQTNILSLNAAVEAATAGEAGQGFAVVAGEVRNLANRSAQAAKQIKELVIDATNQANEGKIIADDMINGYKNLNTNIEKTLELIYDVENASKEQYHAISQINSAIIELEQQTQSTVSVTNKTQEISEFTQKMAINSVENTDNKHFVGKNNIRIA